MRGCTSPFAYLAILGLTSAGSLSRGEAPALWLYYATNLQVDGNVDELEAVWRRAASAGYSHVLLADSKFARLGDLGDMTRPYFRNVERVQRIAAELKLRIIPACFHVGYSNSLLWHDPNLAEGLPVRDALFVVRSGRAELVPDPPVFFRARPDWHDDSVAFADGVATVGDFKGNARFVYKLAVSPFRCYHVSVHIRTRDFTGRPEIKALAGDRVLQYQSLGAKRSQDWTGHHVVFNSLDNAAVNLYFGVWGGGAGELQWKDWRIEEAGLVNVLRRPGAPCVVKGYTEGQDYEPIVDPRLGNDPWPGEYQAWHEPPAIRTRTIPDGTRLRVSWYHPAIIYDGQVCCCPCEPGTTALLADEARRLKAAWRATGYMMSHDEIRVLNQDESCRRRGLTPGAILADHARQCTKLLAGSDVYVWSDMFDPHHNAVRNYYLVNGDLAGSWEGLDPSVIVVNWNFEKRDAALKFFADRGHRQVIAGYYDGPVADVRKWLASAAGVKGVIGVMYTTWRRDYRNLEAFAEACPK
ncbi:MAG: hypothetical protein AMXMBFR83_31080 [Phycisphaerae bacterium]